MDICRFNSFCIMVGMAVTTAAGVILCFESFQRITFEGRRFRSFEAAQWKPAKRAHIRPTPIFLTLRSHLRSKAERSHDIRLPPLKITRIRAIFYGR